MVLLKSSLYVPGPGPCFVSLGTREVVRSPIPIVCWCWLFRALRTEFDRDPKFERLSSYWIGTADFKANWLRGIWNRSNLDYEKLYLGNFAYTTSACGWYSHTFGLSRPLKLLDTSGKYGSLFLIPNEYFGPFRFLASGCSPPMKPLGSYWLGPTVIPSKHVVIPPMVPFE